MITTERLHEIVATPEKATAQEIAELGREALALRPVHGFVAETLKAIYINAKEEANRTLVLEVITSAARQAMKRMKSVTARLRVTPDS